MMKQISDQMPELSVIVPVYNSANIFPELYQRLVAVLEPAFLHLK